jgi:hypothetical protein
VVEAAPPDPGSRSASRLVAAAPPARQGPRPLAPDLLQLPWMLHRSTLPSGLSHRRQCGTLGFLVPVRSVESREHEEEPCVPPPGWIRWPRVPWSIRILFSLLTIFFIVSKCCSVNRVRNRGRRSLRLQKGGVKSQSWKNRGKITIRLHSRGG